MKAVTLPLRDVGYCVCVCLILSVSGGRWRCGSWSHSRIRSRCVVCATVPGLAPVLLLLRWCCRLLSLSRTHAPTNPPPPHTVHPNLRTLLLALEQPDPYPQP